MSTLSDEEWNRQARNETPVQRLDRHWASLLQELRVVQTGVQLLTGFLLTLPFQEEFEDMSATVKTVYLIAVAASVASTLLLVSPVAMHRILFRQRKLDMTVTTAHYLALAGMALLGVALAAVVFLIFEVVIGLTAAITACAIEVSLFAIFWVAVPLSCKNRDP